MAASRTIGSCLSDAAHRLAAAGIEGARLDARLLLAAALEKDTTYVLGYPEREIPAAALRRFHDMVARRERREPVSRILGYREFWSLEFAISPDTLDPRPDSETLIEAVLARIPDKDVPLRLLDLGTGSGCLLLALLSELPRATGLGIDASTGAVETAAQNAKNLKLDDRAEFRLGDWCEGLEPGWDIILSNPPYIAEDAELEPEVGAFDPPAALFAGREGLDDYRRLIPQSVPLLAPGGLIALEVGQGQDQAVNDILSVNGLVCEETARDLGGIPRICLARKRV